MAQDEWVFECEDESCPNKATWRIRTHGWGMVTHTHYWCDKHMIEHISPYKLNPAEDIVRV